MIKAIIFDCFGVLITDGLDVALDITIGNDKQKRQEVWDLIKASSAGLLSYEELRVQMSEIVGKSPEEWTDLIDQKELKNTALEDYVRQLRSNYKTAMLSNVSANGLEKRYSVEELSSLFDVVVPSGKYGMAKPDTGIYQLTAELLGVPPSECIMIDDREVYCAGAEQAGMASILYRDLHSTKQMIEDIIARSE